MDFSTLPCFCDFFHPSVHTPTFPLRVLLRFSCSDCFASCTTPFRKLRSTSVFCTVSAILFLNRQLHAHFTFYATARFSSFARGRALATLHTPEGSSQLRITTRSPSSLCSQRSVHENRNLTLHTPVRSSPPRFSGAPELPCPSSRVEELPCPRASVLARYYAEPQDALR